MENNTPRIMAYHLAKTLTDADLDHVSGGESHNCYGTTAGPTGALFMNLDFDLDVTRDQ